MNQIIGINYFLHHFEWKKIDNLNGSRSRNAKRGKKAIIIAKMNAIVNKILIDRILFVSNAGV